MKFAQKYKYRHIPFCSRCAAHTMFTPVQNNRVVGAMTFDNPNSNIDPTLVATRTESKLVCNTCGSEMFKWENFEDALWGDSNAYFQSFFSKSEVTIGSDGGIAGCFLFVIAPFLAFFIGVILYMNGDSIKEPAIMLASAWIVFFLFYRFTCGSAKRSALSHSKMITVGKGVSGETVLFNQKTGQIEYK